MNEKKPLVSILVPCFNVEKYVLQCLKSIQEQTLLNFEVICINDGSTDDTLRILNKIAKEDNRFKVINKSNSGYGDSMNKGLLLARGEFVGIVESDDFINKEMFNKLYKVAKIKNLQISRCCYYEIKNGNLKPINNSWVPKNKVFNPNTDTSPFWQAPAIWSAIYKRDWLLDNDIFFLPTPGASYQDTSFAFKCYACCERFHMIEENLLFYRTDNDQSSINQPGKVFCVNEEWHEIYKFVNNNRNRFKHLLPIMPFIQYGTYKWNCKRISSPKMKLKFIFSWITESLFHLCKGDYPMKIFRKDIMRKVFSHIYKRIPFIN